MCTVPVTIAGDLQWRTILLHPQEETSNCNECTGKSSTVAQGGKKPTYDDISDM